MINRITLNLKKASDNSRRQSAQGSDAYAWSIKTFEQPLTPANKQTDSQTLVNSAHWSISGDNQRQAMEMRSLQSQGTGKDHSNHSEC